MSGLYRRLDKTTFKDTHFSIGDEGHPYKAYFQAADLTEDRVFTFPDSSGTFSLDGHTHNHDVLGNLAWSVAGHVMDATLDMDGNAITAVTTLDTTDDITITNNQNGFSAFTIENTNNHADSISGIDLMSTSARTFLFAHADLRTITRFGVAIGGYGEVRSVAGNGLIIGVQNGDLRFGTDEKVSFTVDASTQAVDFAGNAISNMSSITTSSGAIVISGNTITTAGGLLVVASELSVSGDLNADQKATINVTRGNQGLTILGRDFISVIFTPGFIQWDDGVNVEGVTYVADDATFNFANVPPGSAAARGPAFINCDDGSAKFAGGNFTIDTAGVFNFKETTTPTAIPGFGALYTKSNNELFYQSGDGEEHLLHGDAFSNIWFHAVADVEVTISTQDVFTIIDSFTVVGHEDDLLNLVGSSATNTLTLAAIAGGEYEVSFHGSITATGGQDKEMIFAFGITLATPKDITNVTDNGVSPIVITSAAHGLENGDMVEITGVVGNTAANGSFIVDNKATDTFEIVALDGTATTGNGDYTEGSPTGDITILYPGNMEVHRMVRGADFGSISATGLHVLSGGDVLKVYVANLSGTTNLTVSSVSFSAFRIGD